jgi:hypothetical protein
VRSIFVPAVITLCAVAAAAHAEITGLVVVRMDFSGGYLMRDDTTYNPGNQVSAEWPDFDATYDIYRVYALSSNVNDRVVMAHGSDVDHVALVMRSTSGLFWNHNGGSLEPPYIDQAEFDGTLAFDTFLTLGGTDGASSEVIFLGNFGDMDASFNEENAGWLVFPNSALAPVNGRVLLAQFTVPDGEAVFGRMGVSIVGGDAAYFDYTSHPAPEDLTAIDFLGQSAGHRFGAEVATVGDVDSDGYDDFAIGAPFESGTGRVRIYSGESGDELRTINGLKDGERFGSSIAAAGDVNDDGFDDVLIGAPFFGGKKGAVYVFSGADGSKLVKVTGDNSNDRFGASVAGGVDLNNDDTPDFVVGAPFNSDTAPSAGKVYSYSGATFARLGSASGESANDQFGFAVALLVDAEGDNDGSGDVLIGAPLHDGNGTDSGKAYLRRGAALAPAYSLVGSAAGDEFGFSVASIGDMNADDATDFVVGSPRADRGAKLDAGRIDVHSGANGVRLFAEKGTKAAGLFGFDVARCSDVDGDGASDVAVGSPGFSTNSAASAGRVFVVLTSTTNTATVVTGGAGEQAGESVAAIGYVGDPQYAAILAGAWRNDDVGADAGIVRVGLAPAPAANDFRFADAEASPRLSWLPPGGPLAWRASAMLDLFASLRDMNGDGHLTIDDVAAALRSGR